MEVDSQSLDSDEGVELSITEQEEFPDDLSPNEQETLILEAKCIYLLLPKNVAVSRATRLQWLLDHLNTVITISSFQKLDNTLNNIEIISVIARDQTITKCSRFVINNRTEVIFLAHSYRFVYCFDMSPSQSIVDIEKGEILFDEILYAFKSSIKGLIKQFTIPGNSLVFQPNLYLTVLANTPFFLSPAQQVLVKGVQISQYNLNEIIDYIECQFHLIEGKIADVSAMVHEQNDFQKTQYEGIVGSLFDLPENEKYSSKVPVVSPDVNFVNMLRYSMLAVSLLPENSISHILVITDGVVAMPDSNIMESLLFQLHYDSIAVSFLKVGASFQPHSNAGYIPYVDLLYFFSHSTMGTCIEKFPNIQHEPSMSMNIYHEMFLLWSFHSVNKYDYRKFWNELSSISDTFSGYKMPSLLSKRQTDENASASILLLLARRMREGFTIDNISYVNDVIEVHLSLQWNSFIYIHYKTSSQWPIIKNNTHLEVFISAPYEFLHDITCMIKKDTISVYRQAVIERFWMRLSQLSSSDLAFAQQLTLFQSSNIWYTLPESVRSGIPVFILNMTNSESKLTLSPSSVTCSKFINCWQPICQMETNNWRKWFHTHKISIILKHDHPLPKHLHLANSSQRYQVVQCRQAATALYGMLSEWASFVLIDNHTYLKLIAKEQNKPAIWFCIVRITSKLPCAVLNIGFVTNTPGYVRFRIVNELKTELSLLSYMPSPGKSKENSCCNILQKPLEKILIRYERMPNDFSTIIFPDGTQPPHQTLNLPSPLTSTLFTTLSRYLYHKRWIWSAAHPTNPRLTDKAISRILNTLTRMRMKEGFSFAYSSSGIITMVLELWMEPKASCIVQYVLFAPHKAWWCDEIYSNSDEENDTETETETELQMVTEVWIEPQYGRVKTNNPRISYMDNKFYYELADVISNIDLQCINSLLTMEHLSLMCQEKNHLFSIDSNISFTHLSSSRTRKNSRSNILETPSEFSNSNWFPIISPRIEHIPFKFDPISILPLCQQTELLFSMFTERKEKTLIINEDSDKSNKLLLDNMQDHLISLHDKELILTKDESDRFTNQIITRHKNTHPYYCPIAEYHKLYTNDDINSQWRCFIKAISVTHIIITFTPLSLEDLKILTNSDRTNIPSLNESVESIDKQSSKDSNYSDVPINTLNPSTLPIYVYDCPLGLLVGAYVSNPEDANNFKDIYEDHRFKCTGFVQEEILKIKTEDSCNNSPENKNDEYEINENKNCLKHHCKTLSLVHSKCFTMSLFTALHNSIYVHSTDVQSAMDQCEENVSDIDITEYIMTICGHVKHHNEDTINIEQFKEDTSCDELKSFHALIKKKFFNIINVAFNPIPTNSEFYYYRFLNQNKIDFKVDKNNSDDDISIPSSDKDLSVCSDGINIFQRLESINNNNNDETTTNTEINPLFLHLVCTIKYNNGCISNTSVCVLPTCLGELIQNIEILTKTIDKSKLQITLDILCLTLPTEVQNVISEYSSQGLRTTSFCSDNFQHSFSTTSEISFNEDFPEPLINLPEYQKKSIILLCEEIKWLLKDEIATALLDIDLVSINTLYFVMKHVTDSKCRSSCHLDIIELNFVYDSNQSYEKFVQEFAKIKVPSYKLHKEDDLYYLGKDLEDDIKQIKKAETNFSNYNDHVYDLRNLYSNNDEINSQISDISSSFIGTEGGYDEDISDDGEDYDWLLQLNNKRLNLPNFWLIMKIEQQAVTIYFHCRFLDLPTAHVSDYIDVQRAIRNEIRELCKKVNQSLLLQSLYETRTCNSLLESDDNIKDWHSNVCSSPISRNSPYLRLKSMDETVDEIELMTSSVTLSEASLNFKSGYFSCPVVWETHFVLHPRLKTGPGKSGISRGILALKNILDKFSVSNRNNMFVYRDNKQNVFYLRLHENVQSSCNKSTPLRSNEYENAIVSRSPSIASLPLGQNKVLSQIEQNISSIVSADIRPRVRSFGEKESKDGPNEDTLILKVHGITEAGTDVQCDLVQVLQNRLDDAVLDFLSVMLARNAMCPLTPEDVHFIQKPFRPAEVVIRLTMQDFLLQWLDSFIHYLKQNLLQFLNIPKYTDNRSHYHFKDYTESEQVINRINDDNIFIYNQSQNPSSGSRGIACIALSVISNNENKLIADLSKHFQELFNMKSYQNIVSSTILTGNDLPNTYLEFRLWKQGRVNIDNLSIKLKEAISQATWDVVIEYYLLKEPLCEESKNNITTIKPVNINMLNLNKEIEFNVIVDMTKKNIMKDIPKRKLEPLINTRKRHRPINPTTSKTKRSITFDDYEREKEIYQQKLTSLKPLKKLNTFEKGENGTLSAIYSRLLPEWLEFGSNIMAPSVKKHKITLTNSHLPNTTIKELLSFVQDTPKAFHAIPTNPLVSENVDVYVPYDSNPFVQKFIIISRNFDNWKASTGFNGTVDYPDFMSPDALKHSQKFVPAIVGTKFIPRQKISWILIQSDNITIYTYNWARDSIDKLINDCTKLGQWLSVRSCFLNSVTAQKLGLFHNQAITQKAFCTSNNPYTYVIGVISSMIDFPRDESRKNILNPSNIPSILEAFRDSFHFLHYMTNDPAVEFANEIQGMKILEKKSRDDMKKLHAMYQSRTSTTIVPQIFLLMQNSRIIHYCHTPLLFLPTWRLKAAATRDHSLFPSQGLRSINKTNLLEKDSWHTELCYGFFCEYRRYLQTLGFMPLQIDSSNRKLGMWTRDNSSYNSIFYIQKTILGGILLFTVEFNEPFFITTLHAIECNRLQTITSRASINRFTLSFLDECDRIKILMHLHSFTYDYHLRCIYNSILSTPGINKVCEHYDVNRFLDDFMKYYAKAPNFARNLIHADTITIKNLVTEGKQLFDYLLMNVAQYNFKVLDMKKNGDVEYILVQVTTNPHVSYKDSQDHRQTDDFEMTLIVYNLCTPYNPTDNVLHLKYYLILTSKSDIYPKPEIEPKLGKFRIVSSTGKSFLGLEKTCLEYSGKSNESKNSDEPTTFKSHIDNTYVEISQELVNYLGYYSSHEQLMQQMILDKAKMTQKHIREMFDKGMVHCRTHLLWNKLVTPQDSNLLTYDEFMELKNLAKLEHLCHVYPNLGPLLSKPLNWYQGLAKLLLNKYNDHHRTFTSADGNIQHYVILHARYFGAFMLLSMDLHTERGDLYAVYREPHKQEDAELCLAYRKGLLDGFVNCICFYLWHGMI